MKLIHSGKVLKDDDRIDSCNIKPNDFLVVMIAKVSKHLRILGVILLLVLEVNRGASSLLLLRYMGGLHVFIASITATSSRRKQHFTVVIGSQLTSTGLV